MRTPLTASIVAAFAALPAAAGVEEAARILDQAAPLHCEVLTLRFQVETVPAGRERDAALEKMHQRADEVTLVLAEPMAQFEYAVARMTPAEMARVRAHGMGLMNACANAASARYGVRLAIPVAPVAVERKVSPASTPAAKVGTPEAAPMGAAIEARSPTPP